MAYCAEDDIAKFSAALEVPIIPCDLCGSQDGLKRNQMKLMLEEMERRQPGRKDTMLKALANVKPGHLLDRKLFDFSDI
jgi:tRNA 2-thiocytidine biosynthesis protein TtcA